MARRYLIVGMEFRTATLLEKRFALTRPMRKEQVDALLLKSMDHSFRRSELLSTGRDAVAAAMVEVKLIKLTTVTGSRLLKIITKGSAELLLRTTAAEVESYLKVLFEKHSLGPLVHLAHLYRPKRRGAAHAIALGLMPLLEFQQAGRLTSSKGVRRFKRRRKPSRLMNHLPGYLRRVSAQ